MRPNFLIFCTDQMQSYSLGCNGNAVVKTPNIDAIAAEGITFRRAYCNNTVCMPSRATMVTGLTPRQHGLLTNGCCLSESIPTVTQALVDAGYRTHAVGKLHLQPFGGFKLQQGTHSWESRPAWDDGEITALPSPYYGFQTCDFVGGHVTYAFGDYKRWLDAAHPGVHERYRVADAYHTCGRAHRMDLPEGTHYNDWIADRTIDFLGSAGDDPFCLFCSFPDPHFPFAACRPYSEMYQAGDLPLPQHWQHVDETCEFLRANRRTAGGHTVTEEAELREITSQTYGMITHIDDNIGRVMAALRDRGLDENTVVVLMADHGEYLGSHGLLHKGPWPWEELVRVPFVWRLPGPQPARHAEDSVVSLLDFVPTLVDLAGIDPDVFDMREFAPGEKPGLPGNSLRAHFDGSTAPPARSALIEYDEDWHTEGPLCRARGIVDGDWKLVLWAGFEDGLLVDLREDPLELTNLWSSPAHLAVRAELTAKLVERLAYTDRFDTPRISGA